jgi:hypothetical protein
MSEIHDLFRRNVNVSAVARGIQVKARARSGLFPALVADLESILEHGHFGGPRADRGGHNESHAREFSDQQHPPPLNAKLLQSNGYPVLVVGERNSPTGLLQLLTRIPHDNGDSGKLKHFHIVIVISNGYNLLPGDPTVRGPAL